MFPELTEDEIADRLSALLDKYPREAHAIVALPDQAQEAAMMDFFARHKDEADLIAVELGLLPAPTIH